MKRMNKCPACANIKPILLESFPIDGEIEGREGKKFVVKVGFCAQCGCVYVYEIEPRKV